MSRQVNNSFTGGMERDLSPLKKDNKSLFHLENGRITNDGNSELWYITNIKGNKAVTITDYTGLTDLDDYHIVGVCTLNKDIFLFYASDISSTTPRLGRIIKLMWVEENTYNQYFIYGNKDFHLLPNEKLVCWANYENEEVQKLYWASVATDLSHLNIVPADTTGNGPGTDPADYVSIQEININKLAAFPNVEFTKPAFQYYIPGTLQSGAVQYSYRFYNLNGAYTRFAPLTEYIPISSDIGSSLTRELKGIDPEQLDYDEDNQLFTAEASGVGIQLLLDLTAPDSSGAATQELYSTFDRVEIVRLYYNTKYAIPVVSVIDRQIVRETLNIIDTGQDTYGTLTASELLDRQDPFTFETAAVKNNRVFTANITERTFTVDFDARAYRFNVNGVSQLYEASSYTESTVPDLEYSIDNSGVVTPGPAGEGAVTAWENIPSAADAFNYYKNIIQNDITVEGDNTLDYKYQTDGSTIGGEGPNLKYTFTIEEFAAANVTENDRILDVSIGDNEPYIKGLQRSFQSDEIYRFWIEWINSKGQTSFLYWIGDIRTPSVNEFNNLPESSEGLSRIEDGIVYLKHIYPVFQISSRPTDEFGNAYSYRIHYTKREATDKTVAYSGLWGSLTVPDDAYTGSHDLDDVYIPNYRLTTLFEHINSRALSDSYNTTPASSEPIGSGTSIRVSQKVLEFISPEINFTKNTFNPDSLKTIAVLTRDSILRNVGTGGFTKVNNIEVAATSQSTQYVEKLYSWNTLSPFYREVYDSRVLGPAPLDSSYTLISDGTDTYTVAWHVNYGDAGDAIDNRWGKKDTSGLFSSPSALNALPTNTEYSYAYGYAKRHIVQYGGAGFTDRVNNTAVAASPIINTASVTCKYGDTFVSIYDYLRIEHDQQADTGGKLQHVLYFPVESSINLYLRADNCYHRVINQVISGDELFERFLGESGVASFEGNEATVATLEAIEWTSLYRYAEVYSKIHDTIPAVPEPFDFKTQERFPIKVNWSDLKSDVEEFDSWLRYRPNNYNNANGQYGEVTKLIEHLDEVVVMQDKAVSLAQIEPYSQQATNTGSVIVTGSGDILPRFQYLSTEVGFQKKDIRHDVVQSPSTLYWIDNYQKKLYALIKRGIVSLSDVKGFEGFMRYALDINSTLHGIYDEKYSEVLLTVKNYEVEEGLIIESTPATAFINFATVVTGTTITMDIEPLGAGVGEQIIFTAGTSQDLVGRTFIGNAGPITAATSFREVWNYYVQTTRSLGDPTDPDNIYNSRIEDTTVYLEGKEDFNLSIENGISIRPTPGDSPPGRGGVYYFDADGNTNSSIGQPSYDPSPYQITQDNIIYTVNLLHPGMPDRLDLFVRRYGSTEWEHVGATSCIKTNTDGDSVNFGYPNTRVNSSSSYTDPFGDTVNYDPNAFPQSNELAYNYTRVAKDGICVSEFVAQSSQAHWSTSGAGVTDIGTGPDNSIKHWFLGEGMYKYTNNDANLGYCPVAAGEDNFLINRKDDYINYLITEESYPADIAAQIADSIYQNTEVLIGTVTYTPTYTYNRFNSRPQVTRYEEAQLVWVKVNAGDSIRVRVQGWDSKQSPPYWTGWGFSTFKVSYTVGDVNGSGEQPSSIEYNFFKQNVDSILECTGSGNTLTVRDSKYFDIEEGGTYNIGGNEVQVDSKGGSSFDVNRAYSIEPVNLDRYGLYNNNFTIAYNEKLQRFTSFYSFLPEWYINEVDGFITSEDNKSLFKHNIGTYGSFYSVDNTPNTEMRIEFYVTTGTTDNSEWNNLKWYSEVYDEDNKLVKNKTLDSLRVRNDYQQTEEVLLYPINVEDVDIEQEIVRAYLWTEGTNIPDEVVGTYGNIHRVIDHWITSIPRTVEAEEEIIPGLGDYDASEYDNTEYDVGASTGTTGEFVSNRIRSPWIKITLYFNNILDYRFVLGDISTIFEQKIV